MIVGIVTGGLPRAPVPRQALVAGSVLAGLAALTGASMAWGTDDGAAFGEVVRVAGYLGLFSLVVCLSTPGSTRVWLVGLAVGIAVVGALALGSRLVPALPGDDSKVVGLLPAARGRLSYPIGNWNVLAAVLALGVVLLAWLGAEGSARWGRALAVAGIPVLGVSMYLTSSRGGVLVAVVGLAVLLGLVATRVQMLAGLALGGAGAGILILMVSRRADLLDGLDTSTAESQGAEVLIATVVVVAAVAFARQRLDEPIGQLQLSRRAARISLGAAAVVGVAALLIANPIHRFNEFKEPPGEGGELESGFVAGHFASASGSGRYQFWSVAVDAFGDEPLHGIGAGGYEAYWAQNAPIARAIRDAHSLYLESLAELGPLGLALTLALIGVGVAAGRSRWRPSARPELAACLAVLAAGATSAAIEVTWEVPAAFGLVIVVIGLLTGPASAAPLAEAKSAGGTAGETRFGWGVAVLVAGWIALLVAADSFLTQRSLGDSRTAAAAADYEEAAQRANDAIALQPWAAEPRLQLALVQESAGQLPDALAEVMEATDRAPDDWRPWLARARIEARSGNVAAATAALERARSLNPRSPIFARQPSSP